MKWYYWILIVGLISFAYTLYLMSNAKTDKEIWGKELDENV